MASVDVAGELYLRVLDAEGGKSIGAGPRPRGRGDCSSSEPMAGGGLRR